MKSKIPIFALAALVVAMPLALQPGCSRSLAGPAAATPPPPERPVVKAERQIQPDALAFSGRIEAIHRVELRPRAGDANEGGHADILAVR